MTGWLENQGLKFMGLSDDDIAKINERLPDVQNLILVTRQNQAKAMELLSVISSHQAQLNRVLTDLLPILQKAIATERNLGS